MSVGETGGMCEASLWQVAEWRATPQSEFIQLGAPPRKGRCPWRHRMGVIWAGVHFSMRNMGWGVRQIWIQKPVSPSS